MNVTLGMLRAGVEAFYRWDGEEEEPEALVWSICEAVVAALPKCAASRGEEIRPALVKSRLQGELCLVTMSARSPIRGVLLELGRSKSSGAVLKRAEIRWAFGFPHDMDVGAVLSFRDLYSVSNAR